METYANNFTTGSIPKKLLKFMAPIFGALTLQAMYGAADMVIVGRFGTTEGLSAVSTGSVIMHAITMIVAGLTMGITVLIGMCIGEGAHSRIRGIIGGAICFFGCLSAVLTVLTVVFAGPIAAIMQAPEESFSLTVQYISICGAGMLFTIAYNVISGIFRGTGNSRLPLIFVSIACVANIALDLLFVAVWHMNVAGAALATVLSQALSVGLSFAVIKNQPSIFSISLKDIRFNAEIKEFCKLGFPITLQSALTNVSFLLICGIINYLGLAASSGYGVAQKIISFVMLLPATLMQSIAAFVAQNVGANLPKRAQKATWFGITAGASVGLLIFVLAFFCGELLARLFTSDEAVIQRAAEYLRGFSPEAVITCVSFGLVGYFNGSGKTIFTMTQGLAQSFLVRIPVTYAMSLRADVTLTHIGLAVPASTVFGILLCVGYYILLEKRGHTGRVSTREEMEA